MLDRLKSLAPAIVFLVLFLIFSYLAPSFLSVRNLVVFSGQVGILLLVALGLTFVILTGSIDLSVGSVVMISAAVVARLVEAGYTDIAIVVGASVAVGVAVGLLNGAVYVYGRVPSFIATLGMMSLINGFGLTIIGGKSIGYDSVEIQSLAIGRLVQGVQNSALFALGFFVVGLAIDRWSRFGIYARSIGGGERVALLAGLPVNAVKVGAFVASAVTAALAGLLSSAQLSSASPSIGSSALLDALAAIVVGGTSLSGGRGGIAQTLFGVLIVTTLTNGLNQLGVEEFTQIMIKGAVVIGAAVMTMHSGREEIIK